MMNHLRSAALSTTILSAAIFAGGLLLGVIVSQGIFPYTLGQPNLTPDQASAPTLQDWPPGQKFALTANGELVSVNATIAENHGQEPCECPDADSGATSQPRTAVDRLIAGLPKLVCGLRKAELREVLGMPHGTKPSTNRYYYQRRWMNITEFEALSRETPEGSIVCVIVHVEGQMPCKGGECVMQFHLRVHDTDAIVMRALVESEEMKGLNEKADFKTILDGGGNCGIATVLFAMQYPNARIVTVEPALANYNILERNVKQFPNVTPIRAALWKHTAKLAIRGSAAWDMQVTEVTEGESMEGVLDTLDGMSIPFLLQIMGLSSFDFMKIDIEGSEKEVLEKTETNDRSFLDHVQVVMIEEHERFRKGAWQAIVDAFSQGFTQSESGEYFVFTRR